MGQHRNAHKLLFGGKLSLIHKFLKEHDKNGKNIIIIIFILLPSSSSKSSRSSNEKLKGSKSVLSILRVVFCYYFCTVQSSPVHIVEDDATVADDPSDSIFNPHRSLSRLCVQLALLYSPRALGNLIRSNRILHSKSLQFSRE